ATLAVSLCNILTSPPLPRRAEQSGGGRKNLAASGPELDTHTSFALLQLLRDCIGHAFLRLGRFPHAKSVTTRAVLKITSPKPGSGASDSWDESSGSKSSSLPCCRRRLQPVTHTVRTSAVRRK